MCVSQAGEKQGPSSKSRTERPSGETCGGGRSRQFRFSTRGTQAGRLPSPAGLEPAHAPRPAQDQGAGLSRVGPREEARDGASTRRRGGVTKRRRARSGRDFSMGERSEEEGEGRGRRSRGTDGRPPLRPPLPLSRSSSTTNSRKKRKRKGSRTSCSEPKPHTLTPHTRARTSLPSPLNRSLPSWPATNIGWLSVRNGRTLTVLCNGVTELK